MIQQLYENFKILISSKDAYFRHFSTKLHTYYHNNSKFSSLNAVAASCWLSIDLIQNSRSAKINFKQKKKTENKRRGIEDFKKYVTTLT
jgi:hypothetical protein